MSEKLFEDRAELQMSYQDQCDKVSEAIQARQKSEDELLAFDAEHPEVMQAVHKEMGERKKQQRAKERKDVGLDQVESPTKHTAEGHAEVPIVEGEG